MSEADTRRRIPGTDRALADPVLALAAERVGRATVKAAVVAAADRARRGEIPPERVIAEAAAALPDRLRPLRRVINATGVVVHTNLGRAPLSPAAIKAVVEAAGYTDVELDLADGRRARRGAAVLAALAAAVPEAEAAHVVNNNAAALSLVATALAAGREIIVSRGELIEIGDGFRLPDLLTATGARLREVGTTNRTTVADYRAAVGPQTGLILKIHPSNYRIEGFVGEASIGELSTLGPPVVADIGSGLLAPDPVLPAEPDAGTALRAGADLITASGDKLLGGPQAGLLLGKAELVERLRRHPLARALRVDKLTLAALAATLSGPPAPVPRSLHDTVAALHQRAAAIVAALPGVELTVAPSESVVGGGGGPGVVLPSVALAAPASFAAPLRLGDPPVVGRVTDGRLLLDLRAVDPAQDAELTAAIARVAGSVTRVAGDGAPAPPGSPTP
ncbi:L-seryl-tRNA(Sec) selenium transferase [Natronosporangium hydrolyticum]|uniref:L-seryl-tRNA(Sec) selenium transferase n=1 Tax=Natronosporangium hydrolyticum TaxID=2811111 RepID=UPI001EFA07BC|nr:L-seryl-tRNA(Sec) selenium transferase [Natronosporangium hydrolyticum]